MAAPPAPPARPARQASRRARRPWHSWRAGHSRRRRHDERRQQRADQSRRDRDQRRRPGPTCSRRSPSPASRSPVHRSSISPGRQLRKGGHRARQHRKSSTAWSRATRTCRSPSPVVPGASGAPSNGSTTSSPRCRLDDGLGGAEPSDTDNTGTLVDDVTQLHRTPSTATSRPSSRSSTG